MIDFKMNTNNIGILMQTKMSQHIYGRYYSLLYFLTLLFLASISLNLELTNTGVKVTKKIQFFTSLSLAFARKTDLKLNISIYVH